MKARFIVAFQVLTHSARATNKMLRLVTIFLVLVSV